MIAIAPMWTSKTVSSFLLCRSQTRTELSRLPLTACNHSTHNRISSTERLKKPLHGGGDGGGGGSGGGSQAVRHSRNRSGTAGTLA